MDRRFVAATAQAPEHPSGDGPDRVAESLVPPRRL
jgi:hypothetical protein